MTFLFKVPCVGHTVLFLYHFPSSSLLQHSHASGTETVRRLLLNWKERGREGVMESERKIMWTKFQTIECSSSLLTTQDLKRQWGFIRVLYIAVGGKKKKKQCQAWILCVESWIGSITSARKHCHVSCQKCFISLDPFKSRLEYHKRTTRYWISFSPPAVIFFSSHTRSYILFAFIASAKIKLWLF